MDTINDDVTINGNLTVNGSQSQHNTMQRLRQINHKTADYQQVPSDRDGITHNASAPGDVAVSVPDPASSAPPAEGWEHEYHHLSNHSLRINAPPGGAIFSALNGNTNIGGYMKTSAYKSSVKLRFMGGNYYAVTPEGTWSFN